MDFIDKEKRSKIMRSIMSTDTKPEIILRSYLFRKGYRYRKNYGGLPGSPDLVFLSKRIAVFVHGCFWHQHKNCNLTNVPKTNRKFWVSKFKKNRERDSRTRNMLIKLGWKPVIIWECEILDGNRNVKSLNSLIHRIFN